MKKLAFILLSATLLVAATIKASAQDVSTQNRQVSGFSAVSSGGPFNVHIKMEGTESVKVEADTKFINEIFETACIKFYFSAAYVKELAEFVKGEMDKL